MSEKATIYVGHYQDGPEWFVGFAIAYDDGRLTKIAGHVSSSAAFSRQDMGLFGDWTHDAYAKAFPDGYELKEITIEDAKKLPKWNREHTAEEEAARP